MSEKRLMLALVSCRWRHAPMASATGLLLLPARIFMAPISIIAWPRTAMLNRSMLNQSRRPPERILYSGHSGGRNLSIRQGGCKQPPLHFFYGAPPAKAGLNHKRAFPARPRAGL